MALVGRRSALARVLSGCGGVKLRGSVGRSMRMLVMMRMLLHLQL